MLIRKLHVFFLLVAFCLVPQAGSSQDVCEHLRFKASLEGLSRLAAQYLYQQKFDLDQSLKELELEDIEVPISQVIGDSWARWMPFSKDSILRVYSQDLEEIKSSELKMNHSEENLSLSAHVDIEKFRYRTCIAIVEPDGNLYYDKCNIRFYIQEKPKHRNYGKLEITWQEHHEDYLPLQMAKSKVEFQVSPEDLKIAVGGDSPSWLDKILEYFLDSGYVKEKIRDQFQVAETYVEDFFDLKIREIPIHVREFIQVPKIDIQDGVLKVVLKESIQEVVVELRAYANWLSEPKRRRVEDYMGVPLFGLGDYIFSLLEDYKKLSSRVGVEIFDPIRESIIQLEPLLKKARQISMVRKELKIIDQFLAQNFQALDEHNRTRSEGFSTQVSLVSYHLDPRDSLIQVGMQLDGYPCFSEQTQTARDTAPSINLTNFDFALFVPTATFNEMLSRSQQEGILNLRIDNRLNCRRDRFTRDQTRCRLNQKEIRFVRAPYLEYQEDFGHKLLVPKLDLPGPLSTKLSTQVQTQSCENNSGLCFRFFDLKAKGKLVPILRMLNLFLLDIIDVDNRIEKELDQQLVKLGTDGVPLIPGTDLIYSEDKLGPYLELFFDLKDPNMGESFF